MRQAVIYLCYHYLSVHLIKKRVRICLHPSVKCTEINTFSVGNTVLNLNDFTTQLIPWQCEHLFIVTFSFADFSRGMISQFKKNPVVREEQNIRKWTKICVVHSCLQFLFISNLIAIPKCRNSIKLLSQVVSKC